MRPRFAPGRLYDVPVRMGWLQRPLAETEFTAVSPVRGIRNLETLAAISRDRREIEWDSLIFE